MRRWTDVWENARIATMSPGEPAYGEITDGAIAVADGKIAWIGSRQDLPRVPGTIVHDAAGHWITPGLIDPHTHLVFAGDRSAEFEARLEGVSYEDIARAGGGIRSTVDSTRAASEDELRVASLKRLRRLVASGVTTIEIKSGYGLDVENETKILRVARSLADHLPVSIVTTLLGAHALPPEYQDRRSDYIDLVTGPMLEAIAAESLADAVDVFAERIAFTSSETARVFNAARRRGLPVKLHADQLSDQGGAALAARYGALSADHLEYSSEPGIAAMAESGTVAVLLPGAFYFLRECRRPPIETMQRLGVPIALASDCNPGSSPVQSLLIVLNMACTLFGMTPEAALAGVTRHAARALGLQDRGTLTLGNVADFAIWDIDRPSDLAYWIAESPLARLVKGGTELDLAR